MNRILIKQSEFYPELTQDVIDKFTKKGDYNDSGLVYRKRPYYHGPGNSSNPSKYGRWRNYKENGRPEENIFEQLIGIDIIGEIRASSLSFSAQLYNLLNDLNNLTINRDNPKISTDEKKKIIDKLIYTSPKKYGPKDLAKTLGVNIADIKGWRVNNKDKKLLSSMVDFRKWKNIFADNNVDISDLDYEDSNDNMISILDNIASIISLNTDKDSVVSTINITLPTLKDPLKGVIIDKFKELKTNSSGKSWSSFSIKLLK